MINRDRLVNGFLELIRIYSPSKKEREIADVLIQKLKDLGLEVEEDRAGEMIGGNCGNLIAKLAPTIPDAPVLLLSAHMDCVEPCRDIKPEISEGEIRSSGDTILGGDDKAGLAVILEALSIIKEQDIEHGEIQLVLTIAEEEGLYGSKHVEPSSLSAHFGYVLDSSNPPGTIIVKAPGENSLDISVIGRAAHAGIAPEKGLNAIILAARALVQIPDGRIDEVTTANIGTVNGGTATNIVPDTVHISGGVRSQTIDKLTSLTDKIIASLTNIVKENGGNIEIKTEKLYEPYELTADAPVVSAAQKAVEAIGLNPKTEATGGGSDANYFNAYGIPCAVLGIGTEQVHTTAELIKVEDLCKTAELVVEIIRQIPLQLV